MFLSANNAATGRLRLAGRSLGRAGAKAPASIAGAARYCGAFQCHNIPPPIVGPLLSSEQKILCCIGITAQQCREIRIGCQASLHHQCDQRGGRAVPDGNVGWMLDRLASSCGVNNTHVAIASTS